MKQIEPILDDMKEKWINIEKGTPLDGNYEIIILTKSFLMKIWNRIVEAWMGETWNVCSNQR